MNPLIKDHPQNQVYKWYRLQQINPVFGKLEPWWQPQNPIKWAHTRQLLDCRAIKLLLQVLSSVSHNTTESEINNSVSDDCSCIQMLRIQVFQLLFSDETPKIPLLFTIPQSTQSLITLAQAVVNRMQCKLPQYRHCHVWPESQAQTITQEKMNGKFSHPWHVYKLHSWQQSMWLYRHCHKEWIITLIINPALQTEEIICQWYCPTQQRRPW